jgi:dethiobiotin synthetase
MKGIFVTGTDTNIGKTWVGQHLIPALCRNSIDVIPRKPIESGWNIDDIESSDAWLLAKAANKVDALDEICPNRFSRPLSPVRAAKLEDKNLSISSVKNQCLKDVSNNSFLYVEGAGGFYSPLCFDGLNADLASALNLPIILVAENRLGCLNQILLNVEAIEKRGLVLKAIVLNTISTAQDINEMDNLEDLKNLVSYPIIATQYNQTATSTFDELALLISS